MMVVGARRIAGRPSDVNADTDDDAPAAASRRSDRHHAARTHHSHTVQRHHEREQRTRRTRREQIVSVAGAYVAQRSHVLQEAIGQRV